jgi:hypothetical protein
MKSTRAVDVSIQAVSAPEIVSAEAMGDTTAASSPAENKALDRLNSADMDKDLEKSAK